MAAILKNFEHPPLKRLNCCVQTNFRHFSPPRRRFSSEDIWLVMDSASICSSMYDSQFTTTDHDDNSDEKLKTLSSPQRPKPTAICLVGEIRDSDNLKSSIEQIFNVEVFESITGREYLLSPGAAFVLDDFDSKDFSYINAAGGRIFGPTVILECIRLQKELPLKTRPLYCQSMNDVVVCFAGFKDKRYLTKLVALVHHMGGSVRKQFTSSITHVVANTTQNSDKYRLAIAMGRPVMSENWILKCWDRRRVLFSSALSEDLASCKLPPFFDLKLAFYGFSDDETVHMKEQAEIHGAVISDLDNCTHVVVDGNVLPVDCNQRTRYVTGEWFWVSIQLNVCANEDMYAVFEKNGRSMKRLLSPSNSDPVKARNGAFRRSSSSDKRLSCSFLDASGDASSILADRMFSAEDLENFIKSPKRGMSKRQQICIELLQTENNYFQILHTITTLFKEQLEKPDQLGGELLDSTEIRLIFGNLPPIYDVHKKINRELANLIVHWNETHCIGSVWLNHQEELVKAYPPFVNFFEKTKETLIACDLMKPRFHAFLKVCQSKGECNRQTLQELLIRPVQRLPSVILLLNDLLKHTEKSNPDHSFVVKAIDALKSVLTYINDDKRKTEGQVKMFDIVNDIKDCPAYLLSSQRQLMCMVQVVDLSHSFTDKNVPMTVYLFNDCLEVAKKRQRAIRNETKSPTSSSKKAQFKSRKHIDLLFLSNIRRVIDIISDESDGLFCLTVRELMGDKNYPFQITETTSADQKMEFLRAVCNQVVSMTGRIGFEIQQYDVTAIAGSGRHMELEGDLALTINKALKNVVNKPNARRLSRTFSFTKSPAGPLRRAVSQMTVAWTGTLSRMSRSNLRLALQEIREEGNNTPPIKTFQQTL